MKQFTIIILIFCVVGCAAKVTRESLSPIQSLPRSQTQVKSIEIRYYSKRIRVSASNERGSIDVSRDQEIEKKLFDYFRQSESFQQIDISTFSSEKMSTSTENKDFEKIIIDKPMHDTKADFFVDFTWVDKGYYEAGPSLRILWVPFVVVSLGMLPYFRDQRILLQANVFNRATGKVQNYQVYNDVRTWFWTPLVLAPGSTFMAQKDEQLRGAIEVGLQNLAFKLAQEGALQ